MIKRKRLSFPLRCHKTLLFLAIIAISIGSSFLLISRLLSPLIVSVFIPFPEDFQGQSFLLTYNITDTEGNVLIENHGIDVWCSEKDWVHPIRIDVQIYDLKITPLFIEGYFQSESGEIWEFRAIIPPLSWRTPVELSPTEEQLIKSKIERG